MKIGVLPVGYFDGVDRRLSNKGFVSIGGVTCPIIGRVSMNLTTIDLGSVKKPRAGDQVVIYSNTTTRTNSIVHAAKLCGTIPYDLLIHLSQTTKRIIS